ncbi:hypothetical protein ACEPAG_2078 [Sanghuangporus baumii]
MKFFAVLASLVAAVAAQRVEIFSPTSGQTLTEGQSVTICVVEPNSQTSIEEIGIGIAIRHCDSDPCVDNGSLGSVLYHGPYSPQFDPSTENMPNQNFTVTIPNVGSGTALLSVAHASFIGASGSFFTEITNVTVNIA